MRGIFRRPARRIFRRGRRQSAAVRVADLASRAARLDRRSDRAAARSCGRAAAGARAPACSPSPARRRSNAGPHAAAARRRRVVFARSRPDGARCRAGDGHRGAGANARRVSWSRRRRPSGFDLLSVDVEGHELEVLSGFDFARWRPQLILLEDHVGNLQRHRFLKGAGYRLIRRFENNGWYVPKEAQVEVGLARALADRAQILSGVAVSDRAQCLAESAPPAQGLDARSRLKWRSRYRNRLAAGTGRRTKSRPRRN